MRIAFLNPHGNFDQYDSYWSEHPDFGGQLVYIKEVAQAIAAQGYSVDILTRQIIDPDWPEFAGARDFYPQIEGVRILRFPCGPQKFHPKEQLWPHIGKEWVENILTFYQDEGEFPDAFTAHYADGGLAGALLSRRTERPFTFTAHSLGAQKMDQLEVDNQNISALNAQYHFKERILAERIGMNHAARVMTYSDQERVEQFGHRVYQGAIDPNDRSRFSVIPPGVNQKIFSPKPSALDVKIEQRIDYSLARDLPADRITLPLVLAAGRLERKKNLISLVKAFALSPELQAGANLAISVRNLSDPLRQYHSLTHSEAAILDGIMAVVNAFGLRNCLTAFPLNDQHELAAAYRVLAKRRSVFSLTSLYEPFGLAPLESMSCGLPVVVTQCGGPSESLNDRGEEYGILIDPTKPADIARGLLHLLNTPTLWQQYQQKGFKRVQEKYNWERTAWGYLKAIQEIRFHFPVGRREAIPVWFTDPTPQNQIPLTHLCRLYFHEKC